MKQYLMLENQINAIVDFKQDHNNLRKEITSILYAFFKCNRVIYCSASTIITVPDEKLAIHDKEDILEWFALKKRGNNNGNNQEIDINEQGKHGLFKLSKNLGIAVLLPITFYNSEYKKVFTSYFALGYKQGGKAFTPIEIDYLDRISASIRTLIASTDYEELKTWNPSVRKHYRQSSSHLKSVGSKGYPDSGYIGGSLA